ncbi:MAG: phosphate ABC transporter permease PstA [Bdellovibrionaceae bacterium]|nr:phosphate ABC transporter permease PstA [Bdellovibrionales bacterium]MCB9084224.1 phosphate ABC transporter permease PstA [Pseudobdellovibrionaceae bacterium]
MEFAKTSLREKRRKWKSRGMMVLLMLAALLGAFPFVYISWYVLERGFSSLDWAFFTQLPKGPGETGGGMANAILGSGVLVFLASLVGIPWGMAVGVYLSEFSFGKTAKVLRFTVDLLASVPSIVIGIFVYGLIVVPFGFSAYAGGAALMVIMIPVVARSTEEILKLIPAHIREAGLALGIPRWKVITRIIIPGSKAGVITGIMLAIARIAGETAPLLFTAFGNQFYSRSLNQATASLPVQIYTFAKSGFEDWERQAWAGALVLVFFVLLINLMTRLMMRSRGAKAHAG